MKILNKKFALNGLAFGVLAALNTPSFAAEPNDNEINEEVETIKVTGVRASVHESILRKRAAANIIDGISAEDIGQLPDVSIADSISRIAGITVQTSEGGQADTASIRGLGPDLTLTTLNGRVLTTTNQGSRRVALGRLPSELINRVQVAKTPQAKMIEGGVAGTIEMETIRPLDRKKSTVTGVFRALGNSNASEVDTQDDVGWRGSLSYIDQLMDNKLGVAVGWAALNQDIPTYRVRGANVQARSGLGGQRGYSEDKILNFDYIRNDIDQNNILEVLPNALSYDTLEQNIDRNAVMGVIEYRPNEDTKLIFDAAYIKQDTFTKNNRLVVSNLGVYNLGPETSAHAMVDSQTNNLLGMTLGRSLITNFVNPNLNQDETINLGLTGEWFKEDWKFSGDLSYSWSGRDRTNPTLIAAMRTNNEIGYDQAIQDIRGDVNFRRWSAFDMSEKGNLILGFDPGVEDPTQWGVESVLDLKDNTEDKILSARFDAQWTLDGDHLRSLEFGVRVEEHNAKRATNRDRYFYGRNDENGENGLEPGERPQLSSDFIETSDFPFNSFFDVFGDKKRDGQAVAAYNGDMIALDYTPMWPIWDVDTLLAKAKSDAKTPNVAGDFFENQTLTYDLVTNFDLTEKSYAAYTQANFEFDLFDFYVTGNAGARYVYTDVTSTAVVPELDSLIVIPGGGEEGLENYIIEQGDTDLVPVTKTHSYAELLPSLNLNVELTSEWYLRLAAARTLSRAPFSDLSSTRSVNVGANSAEAVMIKEGQPALDPFTANQADLSLEWYPNQDMSLSLAYYYKKVGAYLTEALTREEMEFDRSRDPNSTDTTTAPVEIRTPVNADTNYWFQGLEFSYRHAFTFLPANFDGFGVEANWSVNDTNAVDDAFSPLMTGERDVVIARAVNVSEYMENIILYHEGQYGSVRFAWQRQSAYNRRLAGNATAEQIRPDGQLDLTVNFKLAKNVRLLGSVTNLTDSNIESYHLDVRNPNNLQLPNDITNTGRFYSVGIRATF
ncbi:TonB-dependent receptor [Catenovulum adriaticum]|uniref:TonB-dependent receptor n=1 Tax=Catenovulum adriaticum TaxID=2984846 RepID=A0ABY7ATI0_9ALTE|nr:TonB-dependent receptor [Catenovulum sp. TS8]WAJ71830.1 TonB-dependent receptor [Catenovulum sp. TS8]